MMGKAPEVTATSVQAAADASQDAVAMYKKKLFYRRLKVIVIGFIALALLLSGCLLGFVLPASIHEDPNMANERPSYYSANQLAQNESLADANTTTGPLTEVPSTLITILKNLSVASHPPSTTTTTVATSPTTLTTPTSVVTTPEPTTVVITSSELTTTSASRKQTTSKWWLLKFQDRISGVKWKHSPHRTSSSTTPTTTTTTTRAPIPSTTSDSPVYKWWLLHWKEHVENAIQKNKMRGNNTTRINATRPPAALVGNERSETVETTSGTWDDIKNQLTGKIFRTNQTGKSNVRSVTSYAQQNITTTMPSVVTRKVEVE